MSYKKDRGFTPAPIAVKHRLNTQLVRGFTLAELLVVIVIIGILAALALPQFSKGKEHATGKEAIANLKLIAAAERIYRMETNAYYPIPAGSSESNITNINKYLRLSITEANWDYAVTGAASAFTSTATRLSGPYSGCIWTIDNTTGEPATATCP